MCMRDPLSAGLAMLGAAIHRISKFRQSHYDEFLDNGYESLKDKEPSAKSLYGDDYIQDIQSCTKLKKATKTAFSSSTKVKLFKLQRFLLKFKRFPLKF